MELIKPFAVNGEREDFSVDTDPKGKVSLDRGFTQLYELKPTEGGLFILRKIFNQMMYLVTNDAVKWKTQTFGDWNENITYPKNAVVRYTNGNVYVSKVANNATIPTNATNWLLFNPSNGYVELTGNQTIAGVKTFSSNIAGSITGNSATATKLETARTINGVSFDGSANITAPTNLGITAGTTAGPIVTSSTGTNATLPTASATASGVVTTGNQTIAGVKTFSSSPVVPTPIADNAAVNKIYVDEATDRIGLIDYGYVAKNYHIVAFGGEFNRADYPKLWAWLQGKPFLKTESQWQTEATANGGICGFYSSGNGTTTFRVPNLDKAFLRPDSRGVGSYQEGSYTVGDATSSSPSSLTLLNYDDNISAFKSRMNWDSLSTVTIGETNLRLSVEVATISPDKYQNVPGYFGVTRPKNIAVLPLIVAK